MDPSLMKAFELFGDIDEAHWLHACAPDDIPAGPVRLLILLPEEDDGAWARDIAKDWVSELRDARQDIYTLEDGQPVTLPK